MSKIFLATFVVIACSGIGAVDYINQAKVAGLRPGQFAVGDYVATVSGRFIDQKRATEAAAERRTLLAMAPRAHLPEAPEGWTRRDWTAADEAALAPRYDMAKDEFLPDEIKENPTMKALDAIGKASTDRKDATEVHVYEKPGALVALRLQILAEAGGGVAGLAMQMAANNIEAMSGKDGFAIVKGVTFREELGLFGAGRDERTHRVFTAEIGGRVRITVQAQAEAADILALLMQIDYDRLNLLPETPVMGIGSDAPEIDPAATRALADEQVVSAAAAQRTEAVGQELRLQEAALELSRRMGAVSDAEYETARAKLDSRIAALKDLAKVEAKAADAVSAQTAALTEADSAPSGTAASGGGFWSMISGALGGGASTESEPRQPASDVKVNRLGGSNCNVSGSGKRCSVDGN